MPHQEDQYKKMDQQEQAAELEFLEEVGQKGRMGLLKKTMKIATAASKGVEKNVHFFPQQYPLYRQGKVWNSRFDIMMNTWDTDVNEMPLLAFLAGGDDVIDHTVESTEDTNKRAVCLWLLSMTDRPTPGRVGGLLQE